MDKDIFFRSGSLCNTLNKLNKLIRIDTGLPSVAIHTQAKSRYVLSNSLLAFGTLLSSTLCYNLTAAPLESEPNRSPPSAVQKKVDQTYIQIIDLEGDITAREHAKYRLISQRFLQNYTDKLPGYLTLKEIHDIAHSLANALRDAGLSFTHVSIPPQKVVGGRLVLKVQHGTLGDVAVYDNKLYSSNQLIEPFEPLIKQPVMEQQLESTITELKQYPGLSLFGYYSQGEYPGEVRLNLRILKEQSSQHLVSFDNYGVSTTGEERLSYHFKQNNVLNRRAEFSAGLVATNGADSIQGLLQYKQPSTEWPGYYGLSFSNTEFDIGGDFEDFELSGSVTSLSFFFQQKNPLKGITDDRQSKQAFQWISKLGLSVNSSEISSDQETFSVVAEESNYTKVSWLSRYNYSHFDGVDIGITLGLDAGSVSNGSNENEEGAFTAIKGGWSISKSKLWYFPYQLLWTTRYQYTTDAVPSAETIPLSGVAAVAGYESGIYTGHSGILNRFSLNSRPSGKLFGLPVLRSQWSLFSDLGYGSDNTASETDASRSAYAGLFSVGAGLVTFINSHFIVSAQLSVPLEAVGDSVEDIDETEDFEDVQFYLLLNYRT